jgi:hypothetical protein
MWIIIDATNDYRAYGLFESKELAIEYGDEFFFKYTVLPLYSI